MNKQYFVWDGINGELEEAKSLEDAQEIVKEMIYDEYEGYHPDAESVYILVKEFDTVINDEDGELTFKRLT